MCSCENILVVFGFVNVKLIHVNVLAVIYLLLMSHTFFGSLLTSNDLINQSLLYIFMWFKKKNFINIVGILESDHSLRKVAFCQ